ncbi:hypothetical protein [Streptomyces fulvoviolaceus]|uniref:hypothetical protein n=1 Tax=Streptomyces fulvoviolaceus TaxID=285535 RepID=UPI0021C0D2F0|nr:hypothetical protein [Streptomyces fulvoviolaceus]MCT9077139.1 hypothetical protein [Streptomyces fulvoviolaceus]
MVKSSRPRIAVRVAVGVVLLAGAVSLLVVALASGADDGSRDAGAGGASTRWYTTEPPYTSVPSDPGPTGGEPTEEPTDEPISPGPSPLPVVTQTVIAVTPGGGSDDSGATLIAALGSLLSGVAAIGTLLHAVRLSRENRRPGPDPAPAPSTSS